MIARASQLFLPTLRDAPADAEAVNHKLLVRGGFVRQVTGGRLDVPPARLACAPEGRADHPRGDGRDRLPGDADAGADAVRALAAVRTRLHPGDLPPQGPQGRRLRAADDPRGDGDVPRARASELPAAAADALPLLDQGARRAASAAGPDPAARVHHEGRLLVRPRRGRPQQELRAAARRLPPHLRAPAS